MELEWWNSTGPDWGWTEFQWCLLLYVIIAVITYFTIVWTGRRRSSSLPRGRTLFVMAHPDDECMFFSPTILTLTAADPSLVYLLCISRGNYRNEGGLRSKELWESCKILGILPENITLLNYSHFPDDPKKHWDPMLLGALLINFIITYDIKVIVTFDECGISGHINHISVFYAILRIMASKKMGSCRAFALDTVNLMRKYTSILDVLLTFVFENNIYLLGWRESYRGFEAMLAHHSQLAWFRRLYLLFSRYMIVNSYAEIIDDDVGLELM